MHPSYLKKLVFPILALAALLKTIVLLQNRSLFLDEINLSRNILEKSYFDLFRPLDYEQFAPPLYLVVVKFFTGIFGANEFGLRLFPFLLGLASLFLFYKIAVKLFQNPILLYPIILFGFSIYMLRYGTENKQYSADVFFALLFLFTALNSKISAYKHFLLFGGIGAIGIWFSMPLVFTLFGVGCYFIYLQLSKPANERWQFSGMLNIVYLIAPWLISFGLFYYFNLKAGIDSKYLQDYWENSYLQLPLSAESTRASWVIIRNLISSMVGRNAIPIIWSILCILISAVVLFRKYKGLFILLFFPILSASFASLLGTFILIPRVSLFLMPIFYLIIGYGTSILYTKAVQFSGSKKLISLILILVPVAFTIAGRNSAEFFFQKYELEESRPVLEQLAEFPNQNTPIYVYHNAVPAYQFYTELYAPKIEVNPLSVQYGVWSHNIPELALEWKKEGITEIWILDSHTFGDERKRIQAEIQALGNISEQLTAKNTTCYLVELEPN